MITPGEADFRGPLAPDIERYLATDTATARDRVKLFRLAWDIAGSAFGSRQVLYERFFASDPLTRARALNALYPKDELTRRVRDFLGDEDPRRGPLARPGVPRLHPFEAFGLVFADLVPDRTVPRFGASRRARQ
jgi:hypothetical protein